MSGTRPIICKRCRGCSFNENDLARGWVCMNCSWAPEADEQARMASTRHDAWGTKWRPTKHDYPAGKAKLLEKDSPQLRSPIAELLPSKNTTRKIFMSPDWSLGAHMLGGKICQREE